MNMAMADIFLVLGGLGLFLFGMKMMANGLEQVAGDRMHGVLQRATSNRFLAVTVGIIATITINSSTAVTIMTVSFVNSGMMNLFQSIGIIMGANVGTTFSAQLIAFRIDTFAPLFIFLGVLMHIFVKHTRTKQIGYIVLGFGVLFFGITVMGQPLRALGNDPYFRDFLVNFTNPVLALLAGFIFTAVIQSSSATMGILVTMHLAGVPLSFETSAFIILGTNIGTSITTVIASIPANRESKRAALFHIMYDIIGSIVFGTLIVLFPQILTWFTDYWAEPARQVAMFHTLYNFATMFLLLPFVTYIARLMEKIVPITEASQQPTHERKLLYLDSPLIKTATLAAKNAQLELVRMGSIAGENFTLAIEAFFEKAPDKVKKVKENEKIIDFLNHKIAAKLVQINTKQLSPTEAKNIGKMLIILSDLERIGDHAVNIADYVKTMEKNELSLSEIAYAELRALADLTVNNIDHALRVYEAQDKSDLNKVKNDCKKIKSLAENSINAHIERLKANECQPESGVLFTDMINDLERSTEHAKNIATSIALEKKWNKK